MACIQSSDIDHTGVGGILLWFFITIPLLLSVVKGGWRFMVMETKNETYDRCRGNMKGISERT
jgi:hypothetical protein